MNKLIMAVAGLGLIASAHAADTSVTINVRKSITPVGVSPQVTYTHATATAGAASAGAFSFDVPAPRGSSNIIGCLPAAYSPSGSIKPITLTRVGVTVYVSNSNMTSGTIATGDYVRVLCAQNP